MAQSASRGATPIASSTGLRRTLPDEQAAPALTITPARSSAITCVAAGNAGHGDAERVGQARHAAGEDHAPRARWPEAGARPRRASAAMRGAIGDRERRQRGAAAPKPTMPATFSVPARRPRSCPPPAMSGASGRSRRRDQRAHALRPADLVRRERHQIGAERAHIDRHACPPPGPRRMCSSAPWRCAMRAASATGWIAPVSLLASISETSAGRGSAPACASSAARSATPSSGSAGKRSAPGAVVGTESCSIAETMSAPAGKAAQRQVWFASVPPLVKTTSSAAAPTSAATSRRARPRSRWRAARPAAMHRGGIAAGAQRLGHGRGGLRHAAAPWRSSRDRSRVASRGRSYCGGDRCPARWRDGARRCGRARAARTRRRASPS